MKIDAALIGGTGVGGMIAGLPGEPLFVPTAYGLVKGKLIPYNGSNIFGIQRHSQGHTVPPHRINYLAVAAALKFLHAKGCLSSAAVGSLNPNWQVGQLVVCSDFIDLSARNHTYFDVNVEHRDFTHPFDSSLSNLVCSVAAEKGIALGEGGVYVNMNGPRYETAGEIEAIKRLGGNLVGMTAASEAVAMRESNIPYACLAVVTNAAAGMEDSELTHFDVIGVMKRRGRDLLEIMLSAAARLGEA